jgi:hypothetical protein
LIAVVVKSFAVSGRFVGLRIFIGSTFSNTIKFIACNKAGSSYVTLFLMIVLRQSAERNLESLQLEI